MNIGLVNEIALMRPIGINVWEVVDHEDQAVRVHALLPGTGLCGHCIRSILSISVESQAIGFEPRFIELAGHINAAMPHATVDKSPPP